MCLVAPKITQARAILTGGARAQSDAHPTTEEGEAGADFCTLGSDRDDT